MGHMVWPLFCREKFKFFIVFVKGVAPDCFFSFFCTRSWSLTQQILRWIKVGTTGLTSICWNEGYEVCLPKPGNEADNTLYAYMQASTHLVYSCHIEVYVYIHMYR